MKMKYSNVFNKVAITKTLNYFGGYYETVININWFEKQRISR